MSRTVHCAKLNKELPALEEVPFPGELGQRIYEGVSAQAYDLWKEHLTTIINHYGLNPADPETRKMLRKEMDAFFFGDQTNLEAGNLNPDTIQN